MYKKQLGANMINTFENKLTIHFKNDYDVEYINIDLLDSEIEEFFYVISKDYLLDRNETMTDFDPKKVNMSVEYHLGMFEKGQETKLKEIIEKFDFIQSYNIVLTKLEKENDEKIEIEISKLDSLFQRMDEIIKIKNGIDSLKDLSFREGIDKYNELTQQFSEYKEKLEKNIISLRMSDLKKEVEGINDIIQEYAKVLNKEIKFNVEGLDINIDKVVFSKIKKHIIDLLFNSLIYGIETKQERQMYEKEINGNLNLKFRQEFNEIVIEISDDGRGIDVDYIYMRALKSGLLKLDKNYTNEEILSSIFHPEMSSTNEIEENKERDLSVTIFYNIIKSLNGDIKVETEKNKFTKYVVRIPLDFIVIKGQTIRINNKYFVIPKDIIVKELDVDQSRITYHFQTNFYRYHSKEYPIIMIPSYITGIPEEMYLQSKKILMLTISNVEYVIFVDYIESVEEMLVRKIEDNNKLYEIFLGNVLLNNESTALVFNMKKILEINDWR